jgi:hypothetical protein
VVALARVGVALVALLGPMACICRQNGRHAPQRAFANASSFIHLSLSQPSSDALCLSPRSVPLLSSCRGLQPCLPSLNSTRSAPTQVYSDYGVTSPLQGSQEITSTLSSQPASQPIQLCFSYTSVQPKLQHSCQHTIEFTSRVSRDGAGSDARLYITRLLQKHLPCFRFIFFLAYFYASRQHDPLPPCFITSPFQAILLPKAKLQLVIQASKRTQLLKYHMTHGSCNFVPPKDLEHCRPFSLRRESS